MIKLNLTNLFASARDQQIATGILNPRTGELRASKPKHDGESAYVWRMVAFALSNNPQHHCMPVTADFDLPKEKYWGPGNYDARQTRCRELDVIVESVVRTVPVTRQAGTMRWARALGYTA